MFCLGAGRHEGCCRYGCTRSWKQRPRALCDQGSRLARWQCGPYRQLQRCIGTVCYYSNDAVPSQFATGPLCFSKLEAIDDRLDRSGSPLPTTIESELTTCSAQGLKAPGLLDPDATISSGVVEPRRDLDQHV